MIINKNVLYVGLNDKTTKAQEINTLDAYKITMRAVQRAGYDGATITEATGFYTHESGAVVIEKSLRIEILFCNEEKTAELVQSLKILFNQESIAIEKMTIESALV